MNKQGRIRDVENLFKGIVTGIIGIIFLKELVKIAPNDIIKIYTQLGTFLIVIAVIITIFSFLKPKRYY